MSGIPQESSPSTPDIPTRQQRRSNVAFGVSAVLGLATAVALGCMGSFLVPRFAQIFGAFGASLPLPTAVLMQLHDLLWLSLVVTLGLITTGFFIARSTMTGLLSFLCVCNLLTGAICVVCLYLPIFSMGQVS